MSEEPRSERLRARLEATFDALGCSGVEGLVRSLLAAWSEPHRRHHGLGHLDACLALFDEVAAEARQPLHVEAALAYHDAVYDTRALDNEKRSAARAKAELLAHGLDEVDAAHVAELVLATAHHDRHEVLDSDAALVVDIDLAILGAPQDEYDAFERGVREEYAWVEEAQYRMARAGVLGGFLARPAIYRTAGLRARFERRARANLRRAVSALQADR